MMTKVEIRSLGKDIQGRFVLKGIDLTVKPGEIIGVIGPNGSGKTTLLNLCSGVVRPSEGDVLIDGRPVGSFPRKELAQWMAVLQQEALPPIGFTVREVIEMGRYPFQNWLGEESEDQEEQITSILTELGLTKLAQRTLDRLSGGERQRVALGKVMAQQPNLLMLDEPTTYLDIGYQISLMDAVHQWRARTGLTVIAVLHDLNLAARYCDRLLLIHQGKQVGLGSPEELLQAERIEAVYGVRPHIVAHPVYGVPQLLL
jgi:iron complex transport system ATP-binding protein